MFIYLSNLNIIVDGIGIAKEIAKNLLEKSLTAKIADLPIVGAGKTNCLVIANRKPTFIPD
jgi:hypothetical protein